MGRQSRLKAQRRVAPPPPVGKRAMSSQKKTIYVVTLAVAIVGLIAAGVLALTQNVTSKVPRVSQRSAGNIRSSCHACARAAQNDAKGHVRSMRRNVRARLQIDNRGRPFRRARRARARLVVRHRTSIALRAPCASRLRCRRARVKLRRATHP